MQVPSPWEVIKIYPPPPLKTGWGGGSELWGVLLLIKFQVEVQSIFRTFF